MLVLQLDQTSAVVKSSFRVVDRARADNDEDAMVRVCALDNCNSFVAAVEDGLLGSLILAMVRDLVYEPDQGRLPVEFRVEADRVVSMDCLCGPRFSTCARNASGIILTSAYFKVISYQYSC